MDNINGGDETVEDLANYLLDKTFGEFKNWNPPKLIETVGPFEPNAFDQFTKHLKSAVSATESYLKQKSIAEIKELHGKVSKEGSRVLEIEGNRGYCSIHLIERKKPSWLAGGFGHPDYAADFKYWGQMSSYSLDEAVALIVGVEPKFISKETLDKWGKLKDDTTIYPAIRYIVKQRKLLENTFPIGYSGWLPIEKRSLKLWIDHVELDIDDRFYRELDKFYPNENSREQKPTNPIEDSSENFDIRERASMLKMIIAMAVDGYGYKIDSERSSIPKEIADALDQMGISLDLDTIRKYLKEGRDILPKDYKQE